MKTIKAQFQYIQRDAIAGIVTGIMAVPLTVGICLMSEYPIQTGLVTVFFACIIGFVAYLFKPGNYVGVPGVAAGLAPALALGVHTFGMENMPFLIFLTATMQAVIWKYDLEKYILKTVPHYLVEGLLAGVGLKIAMKFLPFTYETTSNTGAWLTEERLIMLGLSAVFMVLFVYLYYKYKKTKPGIPYFVILTLGIATTFFIEMPMLHIDSSSMRFILPIPHLDITTIQGLSTLVLMFGYALMLASIDVIEQVMSNVAIEKIDPLNRKCDTNNSLYAIWIANMGASFFGGMTNLDGLAKGTTNATAGAMTKVSNLFVALVIGIVVLFPAVMLAHLPKYVLGIIMIYTGWKMIAGLKNIRRQGSYAFGLAIATGLLVFQLGIFEGLLIALAFHGVVRYFKLRKEGCSLYEIKQQFLNKYRQEPISVKH